MASREASLKVTLQPASFQAGLRRMGTMTSSAGKAMGRALKGPMVSGLKAAKAQVSSMLSTLKSGVGIAASLGGALSFGGLAKDALRMQNTYKNISFNVEKVAGNSMKWQDVQKLVNDTVKQTGRNAGELADEFMKVFEATGKLDVAKTALKVIGTTATATGHGMSALGTSMQIAERKFQIAAPGLEDAMARMIEKTGIGGKGIEQMTDRFAVMAGEASAAGMSGAKGISQLLGMMLLLDSSIGEKADPGLIAMFDTVKGGTANFDRLKKAMGRGITFESDMTAMDKIRATLESASGLKEAKATFTSTSRIAYDAIIKPFTEASKQAKAAGKSVKEQHSAGLAAYDAAMTKMGESSMKFTKIQDEAAERLKTDPLIKMNMAFARISDAFTKPQMIAAMDKLADKAPAFADAVVWALNTFLDNPWETIAIVVAAKVGMAFAGGMVAKAVASGMARLLGGQAAAAGVSAATAAGGGAATAAGGAALGAGGTAAAGGGVLATLGGGVAAAGTAAIAGTVGAGLAVGGGLGYAGFKYGGGESGQAAEFAARRRGGTAVSMAGTAATSGSAAQMSEAILELSAAKQAMANNESLLSSMVMGIASLVSDVESPSDVRAKKAAEITEAEAKLRKALDDLRNGTDYVATSMRKLGAVAKEAARGPMPPAEPSPGASPQGVGG